MQQLSLRCPKPIKVSHVITGLHVGGAEAMLYKLLAAIDTWCDLAPVLESAYTRTLASLTR